ncbi:C40 family peptidase [Jatrophihabitans endophyticus]|uniref:C40 family peptidase n=1 Tax=Jatrophihabitans endophyticus TaxID=1206085 RepID=UPI0019E79679|nr:NlpC/P60 family protein [Jatrophihabitans endophyticus]MBE7187082.1 C40 family peptidase [Jatrophihabitans endophyticus]
MSVPPFLPRAAARRITGTAVAVALTGVALAAVAATPADASTQYPHNAIGSNRTLTAVTGGVRATGWAGDLDAGTGNVTVNAVLDGTDVVAHTVTSVRMPGVTAAHHLGPTPGYTLTVPVPKGTHTLCLVAKNVGAGLSKVLDCAMTPLGTHPVVASHDPVGAVQHAYATKNSLNLRGWAQDPDDVARRSVVTMYMDGSAVATDTTSTYAGTRPDGVGRRSAFAFDVPASTGSHLACLWVSNVGIGQRTFLGCHALDTRKQQPITGGTTVATAAKVVTQAKKHIGQRYVWGAEGPKAFDCSGLVTYSYGKFGYSLPHQSALQFEQARVIPAAEAVPGDLVFYHDATGSVYHVGIYTKPGMTVAAIDTQEGVNYQSIYSSTWATYGSVSHT